MNEFKIENSGNYQVVSNFREEISSSRYKHKNYELNDYNKFIQISQQKIKDDFEFAKEFDKYDPKRLKYSEDIKYKYDKFLRYIKDRHFKQFNSKQKRFEELFEFKPDFRYTPNTFITENLLKNYSVSLKKSDKNLENYDIYKKIFGNNLTESKNYNSIQLVPLVSTEDSRIMVENHSGFKKNFECFNKNINPKFRSSILPRVYNMIENRKNQELNLSNIRKKYLLDVNYDILKIEKSNNNIGTKGNMLEKIENKETQCLNNYTNSEKEFEYKKDSQTYFINEKNNYVDKPKKGNKVKNLYKNNSLMIVKRAKKVDKNI